MGAPPSPQPKKSGGGGCLGCFTSFVGVFFGFWFFFILLYAGHYGIVASFALGLALAVCAWAVVFGVARLFGKHAPVAVQVALPVVTLLFFAALGPLMSAGLHRSTENNKWEECTAEDAAPQCFPDDYAKIVPKRFQREEWRLEWMRSRIREAKQENNATKLREIATECHQAKDSEALAPAQDEAITALSAMYDVGKAKMYAPSPGGAAREFPVDEGLRRAFSQVLEDLAKAPDAHVYVAFSNTSRLEPPEGMDRELLLYRSLPNVRAAFPKGAPVLEPGNAFSPEFDDRRRHTFMKAMTESFGRVFEGQLLTLVPLEAGADGTGKLVISVQSRLYRIPRCFTETETVNGTKRVVGLLFGFEVEWRFRIMNREGKLLYEAPPTVSRPTESRFSTPPGSPRWAPYSVLMDSAYYNYSREVTGRFGLTPPPKKQVFVYGE